MKKPIGKTKSRPKGKSPKKAVTLEDKDKKSSGLQSADLIFLGLLESAPDAIVNTDKRGDEFDGMLKIIEKAAGFCIIGPDGPKTQKRYVKERGWKAKLYSAQGSSFIKDLGFEDEDGDSMLGISVLQKEKDGKMSLVRQTNVPNDGRAPSVLEVLWMVPGVEARDLAWEKS